MDCPIAANLVDVIESFKDSVSIEEADISDLIRILSGEKLPDRRGTRASVF